jgi:hypothetical protein
MANDYYQDAEQIAEQILNYLNYNDNKESILDKLRINGKKDSPYRGFHGPF